MKRQWIVIVVVVISLVTATTARAQESVKRTYTTGNSTQWCGAEDGWAIVPYPDAEWQGLSSDQKTAACKASQVKTGTRWANQQMVDVPEPQIRSRGLAIAGLVTMFAGIAMVMPAGDTYTVLGDAFCVSDYSVDSGPCTAVAPLIGLGAIGGGIAMMVIGLHDVSFSPIVRPGVKGVSAKIAWGGKHAR